MVGSVRFLPIALQRVLNAISISNFVVRGIFNLPVIEDTGAVGLSAPG